MFTEKEIAYLNAQRIARIATVNEGEQPDVVPVGFEFDGSVFYVGSGAMQQTRKYKNITAGRSKVALVIDELVSTDPWTTRSIRIYGTAEPVERDGRYGAGLYLKITPAVSWSWAVNDDNAYLTHKTVHTS